MSLFERVPGVREVGRSFGNVVKKRERVGMEEQKYEEE
jgi:hypothetical protein